LTARVPIERNTAAGLTDYLLDYDHTLLTHNRPLICDLQAKYEMLSAGDTGVEWRTFLGWCLSQWPNRGEQVQAIGKQWRRELIAEVRGQHFVDTAVTEGMLETELDWFKDRTISKRSEYLAADRTGRGFALQESMRNRFFDAFAAYQKKLEALGQLDWGDVPRLPHHPADPGFRYLDLSRAHPG
jgi:hypothetical protein